MGIAITTRKSEAKQSSNASQADTQLSTITDNRSTAIAQRKLIDSLSTSPRGQRVAQLQAIIGAKAPVQRAEDEEVQMKAAPIQRAEDEEVQRKAAPVQKKENNTGLPDNLKSGVENLSGVSMNDVQVHRNSDQPAQMQAHAFAQGTDIHVASGQEQHLPHEAWHVVQQKQGRVKPTTQMKGQIPVNDDKGLEHEADVMGAKTLSVGNSDQGATQLKEVGVSKDTVQKTGNGDKPTDVGVATEGIAPEKQKNQSQDQEMGDMAALGLGFAGDAAATGASAFSKVSEGKEFVDATSAATGASETGTFKGAGDDGFAVGDVGAAAGQVLGVVGSGYKAFMAGWQNQEKGDDVMSRADAGMKGASLISKATEMSMHFAKSDTVAGLFPGVNSGIALLQAGLDMMKDKRAADAISKIETGGGLNADASIYLKQYASNIHWKMIEDGAEAVWAAAELIGLAFPGANVGIGLLHSATNLLKGGVKMYQAYASGKKAKAAERLEIGAKGGLSKDELQQVQSTKEILKNAGDASNPWFLSMIKMEQQKTDLEAMKTRNPEQVVEMNKLQQQINYGLDVYQQSTGTKLTEKDILNATTLFLNLIRSLKDDIMQDHGRFKRFENWISGGYFGQKVSAQTFFTDIFGDNPENKKTDLEILTALEADPKAVGEYLGPKLSRTIESAEGYSAADLSNDQLVNTLKPELVSSAAKDPKVFATFEHLAPDIFKRDVMYIKNLELKTTEFSQGLDQYFSKINPF